MLLFSGKDIYAQSRQRTELNLPFYDDKRMHYGFTLGMNAARFNLTHSNYYLESDTLTSALSPGRPGFSLGFIVNMKFADYFDLRLLPTVSFYERTVVYRYRGGAFEEQQNESTFIEFPLLVKYKSQRRGNMRMYAVGGVKAGIEAGANKRDRGDDQLRVNTMDFAIEYGAGLDFYFPLFKFSPEIRLSHGLVNLLSRDPNIYARSLNRLNTHTISLFLHFE
ncbi:porin family protein [Cytophagaceae bacterium ABcell3]|nr:porin family protein [Cytophagaceae bacterium ABcell3]